MIFQCQSCLRILGSDDMTNYTICPLCDSPISSEGEMVIWSIKEQSKIRDLMD